MKSNKIKIEVGDMVVVHDRYRFAIPLKAKVLKTDGGNDGVELELHQSNAIKYPIGSNVWVSKYQLTKEVEEIEDLELITILDNVKGLLESHVNDEMPDAKAIDLLKNMLNSPEAFMLMENKSRIDYRKAASAVMEEYDTLGKNIQLIVTNNFITGISDLTVKMTISQVFPLYDAPKAKAKFDKLKGRGEI